MTSQMLQKFAALPASGKKNELLHFSSGSQSEIADVSLRTGDRGRHGLIFATSALLHLWI